MIRFTLLQARIQIIIAVAGLALMGVLLLLTAHHPANTPALCTNSNPCTGTYLQPAYEMVGSLVGTLLISTPALIGIFWGAPLIAREFDYSTNELVLTQSVTRVRWLVTKLVSLGLLAMFITALLSLMLTAWAHNIDAYNKAPFETFDQRNIAPIAHAALAFVIGATAGFVAKRVIPAMVVTLVLVVALTVAFSINVRPHLATPRQQIAHVNDETTTRFSNNDHKVYLHPVAPPMSGALVMQTKFVDAKGKTSEHLEIDPSVSGTCADLSRLDQINSGTEDEWTAAINNCLAAIDASYDVQVTYQPAFNYWKIQWVESALYLGLALLLGGLSIVYIRRIAS